MTRVRKTIGFSSLLFALTLTVGVQRLVAQQTTAKTNAKAAHAEATASTALPVTRVSLYKNGVGFFEHAGRVTGDQSVTIDFTTAQLNDVLQSLTAIDLNGGRIAGAGYNSTTPLEQQLKALPLALGEDPTAVDFYNAIRGARVEVHGPGATISGRLLNIELVNTPSSGNQPAQEKRLITVVGEGGEVRTVELTASTEVRLLDADLHKDVTRYLELLASTRNQGLRHLTLQDNGTGARELRVSYISEVPIWKSTYRILFTEPNPKTPDATAKQTATLQGWSVVDNTTGADWINVKLSLIAGAPQSFIQPLSVPYYSRRPEIGLPQEAQLTPQTHESGEVVASAPPPPPPPTAGVAGTVRGTSIGMGRGSGMGAGVAGGLMAKSRATSAGQSGIYGGTGQAGLNENYVEGVPASNIGGTIENESYSELAEKSVTAKSTTAAFDDYFAYNLTEPITIRKNESAMVPILQTKIDAERVTLWSAQKPTPLRALWITNTSNLTLDRGSFSIVEDGNFGGEGLLDPIHPAEKRLLSYAVDQAVRVSLDPQSNTSRVTSISAAKGVVVLHNTQVVKTTYVVRNAADEVRTVVVEQRIRSGYTLGSDVTPVEKTPTVYRFRVEAKANETEHLTVTETELGETRYQLSDSNDDQLKVILDQTGHNSMLEAALAPILDSRRHVAEKQDALNKANSRLVDLQSDEQRQRENVAALAKIDAASRERFVRELNKTEDQIISAQKELNAAMKAVDAAKDDLANKIESLQIDEKI